MSNITPQIAQINNKIWNEIEQRERIGFQIQSIEVLNWYFTIKNHNTLKPYCYTKFLCKIIKTPNLKNAIKYQTMK